MDLRSFYSTLFDDAAVLVKGFRTRASKNLVVSIMFLLPAVACANQFHDLQLVQASVASFLNDYYADTQAEKIDIRVSNLDRRLKLAQCELPLSLTLNDPSNSGGNLTVHTRCEGTAPWSVYVPAQVSLFRELLVANRNLVRGDIVTHSDVVSEIVNTSQLRQGQIEETDNILGQEVIRPISKGEPFRNASLASPMVIKRGDPVIIELQSGSISVSSNGTAMANGRIGERIRIRNGQSDRMVSAQVIAAGRVLMVL